MNATKLVRMANQIATFFDSQRLDDPSEQVATHLLDFWDPSMRTALEAHLRAGGEGLSPTALRAARRLVVGTDGEGDLEGVEAVESGDGSIRRDSVPEEGHEPADDVVEARG